jgi:hypothetical protein
MVITKSSSSSDDRISIWRFPVGFRPFFFQLANAGSVGLLLGGERNRETYGQAQNEG